jgi:hypothetical protein
MLVGRTNTLVRQLARYVLMLACLFCLSGATAAQSIYQQLDAPFYDPGGSSDSASCDSNISTTGGGLPTAIVNAINQSQSAYEQAAQATGVPWQVLAAIHYRENSNNPNGDLQAGNPIGGPYTHSSTDYAKYGYPKSLEQSAEIAAKHLIATVGSGAVNKPVNVPSPDSEGLKDALYSYNGRASAYAQQAQDLGFNPQTQPYEGSPYVMNNFDQVHKNMKIITQDNGPLDGIDTRFGAYTIYSKLGGDSSSGGCSSGAVAGSIVQTAINYAWPDYHKPDYCREKPSYQAAIEVASGKGEYVGGTCTIGGTWVGVDCGAFVTRVMRDSQADANYNQANGNTIAQQTYLDSHPEKYQKLTNATGTKDLQAGDIAINSDHTYIYVGGSNPGFNGNSASASFSEKGGSWRAPMASTAYGIDGQFSWYRLKAGG